jgi:hypothetical protein
VNSLIRRILMMMTMTMLRISSGLSEMRFAHVSCRYHRLLVGFRQVRIGQATFNNRFSSVSFMFYIGLCRSWPMSSTVISRPRTSSQRDFKPRSKGVKGKSRERLSYALKDGKRECCLRRGCQLKCIGDPFCREKVLVLANRASEQTIQGTC